MTETLYAPSVDGDREKLRPKPSGTEGVAPEDKAKVNQSHPRYIAWIPCVSGELFFSETAHGLGICDRYLFNTAFYTEEGQFKKRIILSTALVSWQDTQFTSHPLKGLYRVFFIAESSSHDWLEASVFLVEKNRLDDVPQNLKSGVIKPSMFWPRPNDEQELQALETIEKLLGKKQGSIISENLPSLLNGTDALVESIKHCIGKISSSVVHSCNMQIHSSGISEINFVGTKNRDGNEFAQTSTGARLVSTQVFYYAKYLLHKHTHHSSENDSLTTAHLIKESKQENADVLIRDLKRALVCGQRSSRTDADHTAKGIAQYGKALINSCNGLGLFSKQSAEGSIAESLKSTDRTVNRLSHQRYMDILGSSAQITQDRNRKAPKYSAYSEFITSFKNTALLLLAIIGPLLLFLNIMVFAEYSQRLKDLPVRGMEQANNLAPEGSEAYDFDLLLTDALVPGDNSAGFDAIAVESSPAELMKTAGASRDTNEIEQQFQKLENFFCRFPFIDRSCKTIVETFKQYAQADVFALLKILATLLLMSLVAAAMKLKWGKVNMLGVVNERLVKLGTLGSTYKPFEKSFLLPITMLSLYIAQARIALLTPKRTSGLLFLRIAIVLCVGLGIYLLVRGFSEFINTDW